MLCVACCSLECARGLPLAFVPAAHIPHTAKAAFGEQLLRSPFVARALHDYVISDAMLRRAAEFASAFHCAE